MPRKSKAKNSRRKKPLRRLLSLGPTYPNCLVAKHRYTEDLFLSGGYTNQDIPASAKHAFRTASMYDPDHTTTGHQPLFFDQMNAIYNKYRVLGSVIKVKFINCSSEPVQVFLRHSSGTLGAGWDTDKLRERGTTPRILSSKDAGGNSCTLTSYYSPSQFYGQSKKSIRNDAELGHDLDAGLAPLKMTYWELLCAQIDTTLGGSDDHRVKCIVEINYTAMWNDIKDFNSDS